jgi:ribulose-5-phosphate 4-epimerase/fuculose-1-phosphate aldolase
MITQRPEYDQLVAANRILYREGVVDGLGHISIRHPDDPNKFVMSRSRAPGLVEFEDLMEFQLDGTSLDPQNRTGYGERIIHGAIMQVRPDVMSVVHNHSPAVLPYTITGRGMQPCIHTGAIIGDNVPTWDIRNKFGDATDMLVRSAEQGADLAQALGNNTCILMRGHGATIAGRTLKEAVIGAIYLQLNAQVMTTALQLGDPILLTQGEIAGHSEVMTTPLAEDRMWEYYCMRAGVGVC